jgi:hypothetical protein
MAWNLLSHLRKFIEPVSHPPFFRRPAPQNHYIKEPIT